MENNTMTALKQGIDEEFLNTPPWCDVYHKTLNNAVSYLERIGQEARDRALGVLCSIRGKISQAERDEQSRHFDYFDEYMREHQDDFPDLDLPSDQPPH